MGGRIRLRRTLLGLSQTALGARIGLTFQQVQKYEGGANRVSASMLYHIAEALDVPMSFFFDDMGEGGGARAGTGLDEPLSRRESLELMRNYGALPDPLRRDVSALIRTMAQCKGCPEG
ncbi:MAG: helix-turn-helix domain-containing protein [Ignavibacteriales bacterium]